MSALNHVAIIMDGNGRWANERSRPRVWGHVRGSHVISKIIEAADRLNIKELTLYAFSTENWRRPQKEILVIFKLLEKFLAKERERVLRNNIIFKVIGSSENIPIFILDKINKLTEESAHNSGLKLNFAFNYGGRLEIVELINQLPSPELGKMTVDRFDQLLKMQSCSDVDLLIRTGGDRRVSNFLLWQIAYGELYFTDTKWPDFTETEFIKIIEGFMKIDRRFGGVIDPKLNGFTSEVVID
jgi:undecaprenyl diphosphate synthase